MAQDTALLRYLLKGARRAPGSGSQRDLAFAFDGTNDYISSNAVIGRTGYDMNVSGNVSTGSDGDGSYIQFNGNRNEVAVTGTLATMVTSTNPTLNQTTSFTLGAKFKFNGVIPSSGSQGVYGRNQVMCIYAANSAGVNVITFRIRNGATFTDVTYSTTVGVAYIAHLVYDTTVNKMYCYINGTLLNAGGTTLAAATFGGTQNFYLGDQAVGGGTIKSTSTNIYRAFTSTKAYSQAEIDADIALGNTAKNDPSIVAYYIPDNLTYNTQYGLNPKALDQSNWIKTGATTVTADTTIAPDGTTTADTLAISGTASQGCTTVVTSISGATIASKTFIVKAFVKVAAGTSLFRLECSHNGVATYNSSDQTATTTRQEFTFTKTFTSSTSGTGIIAGIVNSTGITNPILEVRNVRLFSVNEVLYDESPNVGGYLGWKQNRVLSCWVKPGKNGANNGDSQALMVAPYVYIHIRYTTNDIVLRYENTLSARTRTYQLGTGFTNKVHVSGVYYRDTSNLKRDLKLYVDGQPVGTIVGTPEKQAPNTIINTALWIGRKGTTYFQGSERDIRAYTFTGSFTDADALAIYNGGEPTSSGVTKYLHYRPPVGEVGTTTQDQSTNDKDGTLNNGVTRNYI